MNTPQHTHTYKTGACAIRRNRNDAGRLHYSIWINRNRAGKLVLVCFAIFGILSLLLTLHLLHTQHTQPAGLGYLFAIDWLLDRLTVLCNVPGDLTVTAIVANKVNKDIDAKLNEEEIDNLGDERKVDSATKEE